MMSDHEAFAPFWTHIEEFRRTILRMLGIILLGMLACFIFYEPLITFLTDPLKSSPSVLPVERIEQFRISNPYANPLIYKLPEGSLSPIAIDGTTEITANLYSIPAGGALNFTRSHPVSTSLVILGPLDGMLTALKISIWTGAIATSPIWLLFLMQFITPALQTQEKRLIWPFLVTSLSFIVCGGCFAFFVTIPLANHYFMTFNQAIGTNLWTLSQYLDYTLFLILANGFAFELAAVGIFAVHLGLVSAQGLANKRRLAILAAFILGALLTPPDILSQFMLAIPLIILYEGVIMYARLKRA